MKDYYTQEGFERWSTALVALLFLTMGTIIVIGYFIGQQKLSIRAMGQMQLNQVNNNTPSFLK
jgi:hypothetical protein